jgi:hypothetical protein
VSLFTYDPRTGAGILADWVKQLPNLHWISGQVPLEVWRDRDRLTEVRFADYRIKAKIIIDGTELGDLLALGEIPHRWGWELQAQFNEPSAPPAFNELSQRYPVQSPTWVFILQDYGESQPATPIQPVPTSAFRFEPPTFQGAWDNYGAQSFLNYGRLPGDRFMINWPICGNDYGEGVGRLIESQACQQEFLQEAYWHSCNFAHFIQQELGRRYGLANSIFPHLQPAFALHPYYRESRRLHGQVTVTENDIVPLPGGRVAALPIAQTGEVSAIAIGNYANDHHYPGVEFPLQPKSVRWGGRWTGTPFTIPYGSLIPATPENLFVCEKNVSVSHIANGSTRLQPIVMNLGQAAGMAAALCIERTCQPQELPIRELQEALLTDAFAPAAVIPLFNLVPEHPEWLHWQRYYLDHPEAYPLDGNCPCAEISSDRQKSPLYRGIFQRKQLQDYRIALTEPIAQAGQSWTLITVRPEVDRQFQQLPDRAEVSLEGTCNLSGGWLVVDSLHC